MQGLFYWCYMAIDERGVNLRITADAEGVRKGTEDAKKAFHGMADDAERQGKRASKGLMEPGRGSEESAKKVDRSTKSMISSIQRQTAVLEAGSRTNSKYWETLASQRGVDTSALKPYLEQLDAVRSKQSVASSALAGGAIAFDKYGISAKQSAAAMRGVPAQMSDIIVSLQGGQRPMTVLLQQGSQLRDMFGGIVPAARALGAGVVSAAAGVMSMVNPFTLATAAAVGMYAAYRMGAAEGEAFQKTLLLTGSAAGVTTAELQGMSERMGSLVGTQRSASTALNEFANATKIGSGNLEEFAAAALRWEEATGTAVADTVEHFEELGKDPLKASLKLNESMNYLTASVYEQITALIEQGKETEAAAVAQKAFADTINDRAPAIVENIGTIERAWVGVKNAVAGAISAFAGIGRATGLAETLASEEAKLLQLQDGSYQRGAARRVEQVRQQELVVEGIRNQISQESALGMIQKQVDDERRAALKATQDLNSYLGDNSRLSRTAQMEKDVAKEKTLYAARVADAKGNTDALQKLETAHQIALAGIKDKYKEKKGQKSEAQKELERQQKAELKAIEDFEKERVKSVENQHKEISAIDEKARMIEHEIAVYGRGKAALEEMAITQLESERASLVVIGGAEARIATIEAEIDARKRLMAATANKEALDANKKAAEQAASEWQKTNDQIGQSLTDALLRGFESGKSFADNFKSTMINMFKTMVLQPLIQPVMSSVAGGIQSMLGMGGGGISGSGVGMMDIVSGLQTGYSALTGGITNSFASGISTIGKAIGSSAVSSFAAGMSGASSGMGIMGAEAMAGATSATGSAAAGGAAGMGGSFASAIPVVGWIAAGMMAANSAFKEGFSHNDIENKTALYHPGALSEKWITSGLTKLGVSDKVANILTGASLTAKLISKFSGESRSGGSYDWTADRGTVQRGKWDSGDPGAEANEVIGGILNTAVDTINSAFKGIGSDASLSYFMGWAESSGKGRGGTASGGRLSIDGSEVAFGTTRKGQGHGDTSGDLGQMVDDMTVDVYQTVIQAWQTGIGEFPRAIQAMITGVDADALAKDEAAALVDSVMAYIDGINLLRFAVEEMPFENLKDLSFDAAAGLAEFSGGMDALLTNLNGYYTNFYSQEEQFAAKSKTLADSLTAIGITMPELTGSATDAKAAFRAIVDSFDVTTEAGQRQYATMIGLSGTFAELTGVMEQLNAASVAAAQAEAQRVEAIKQAAEAQRQAALDALIAVRDAAVQSGHGAMDALTRSVEASKSALQKAFDAIAESLNASINASRTSISALESMAGRLRSTLDSMRGQTDDRQSRSWAQAQISNARAMGVAPSGADFEQALSIIAQPSEGLFATFEDYQLDFLKTANDIFALGEITGDQLTIEQRTLATLEDQLKSATYQHEAELARYDAMITLAQSQLDATLGINQVMLSIPQALQAIASAIGKISLANGAVVGGGGTSLTGAYDAVDLATKNHFGAIGVGSTIDWAGGSLTRVDENTSSYVGPNGEVVQIGAGQSIADIAAQSQAIRDEWEKTFGYKLPGFAVGTNYVPFDMQANIHEGERIIPKADNTELMRRLSNPDNNSAALVAEIRALRSEVEGLRSEARATAQHTNRTAKAIERAMPDGDAIQTREAVTA